MNRQRTMQFHSESQFDCAEDRARGAIIGSSCHGLRWQLGQVCKASEQKDNRQQDMFDFIA
jgi:hypothetical protein